MDAFLRAEAHANLGAIYQKTDRIDLALAEYQKAQSLEPSNVNTRLNLGTLYQQKNDFEKQIYSNEEYDDRVMDTSINYFYALYLLSKCEAFMSSGQNNGYDTVVSLNEGKFERVHRFMLN